MSGANGRPDPAAGTDAWSSAARLMWQSWQEMAQAGLKAADKSAPGSAGGSASLLDAVTAMGQQWAALSQQALASWTPAQGPILRQVAEGMARGQTGMLRLAEQMSTAWQALSEQVAAGQDPATIAARWAEQMKRGLGIGADLQEAGADMATLWKSWLSMIDDTLGPWARAGSAMHGHLGGAMSGDRSELSELSRLAWDAWEHTGGRLMESPSLGSGRETQERMLVAFDAWLDYRRAVMDYQAVLAELSGEAIEAVAGALVSRAKDGKPVRSVKELSTLWTEAADNVLEAGFRSDRYGAAQGEMVRQAMAYRQAERAIIEASLRNTDIATRSELDEAFQEIHRLRRDLRDLRREMAQARAVAAPSAAPEPAAATEARPSRVRKPAPQPKTRPLPPAAEPQP